MSMLDQLRKEKMEAYKNKETIKNGVLSLLIAAMILKEKESHAALTDEDALTIIQKELKQTRDALEATPANREDLITLEQQKIAILEGYLPKQMTLEEVKQAILAMTQEEQLELTVKNKGVIIKKAMEALKGKSDGKTVNMALGELL